MKNGWPTLALGEALHQRACDVAVNAAESYQFAGVYCFGRGVFRGQEKLGNQFAYQRLTRLRSGDFVYPKLMAWEGAFGIVPQTCDGCVVSPEFPVFELDRERITPEFLDFYFQIPRVWEEVSGGSTGTNVRRRRLHPDNFLRVKIPMPPLEEQRRVVARIEELATQIHEARRLREEASEAAQALFTAELRRIFCSEGPLVLLGEALRLHRGYDLPKQLVIPGRYPVIGSNGEIGRHAESRVNGPGVCTGRSGSIGAVNYVNEDFWPHNTTLYVSDFRGNCPRLVYYLLQSVAAELRGAGAHTAVPTLDRKKAHSQISVRLPPLPEQRQIVAELDTLQGEVDTLKRLQAETAAELDALLLTILDRAFKGEL